MLSRELAGEGWNTAAVARTEETIAALHDEVPGAHGIVANATSPAEVERAFSETQERFGAIDLVVNAITDGPRRVRDRRASRGCISTATSTISCRRWLEGQQAERFASMEEIVKAIAYLHGQSPRAWTHELLLTPALETWVP